VKLRAFVSRLIPRRLRSREGERGYRRTVDNLDAAFPAADIPANYVRSYDEGRPRK
jgi:hypothetical protein